MDVDQSKKGNNKEDDKVRAGIRKFVIKRKVEKGDKKPRYKGPKVQRLITSKTRARRIRKVENRKDSMKNSAQVRRDWLSSVAKDRMKHRQRASAAATRKKMTKKA